MVLATRPWLRTSPSLLLKIIIHALHIDLAAFSLEIWMVRLTTVSNANVGKETPTTTMPVRSGCLRLDIVWGLLLSWVFCCSLGQYSTVASANSFVKQLRSSRVGSPMAIQYISILENLCGSVSLSQQRGGLCWPFLYQAMYWCKVGLGISAKRHPRVPKLPVTRGESLPNSHVATSSSAHLRFPSRVATSLSHVMQSHSR